MNFTVTCSPHIRGTDSTKRIMGDVMLALVPALAVGVYHFGIRGLLVTCISMIAAVAGEALLQIIVRKRQTVNNLSAALTGMLLAMTLPATVPYWIVAVGALFAVIVVKGLAGGLGQNVFNPALGARAFLLLLWPVYLVRFAAPGAELPLLGLKAADIVTSATALHEMQIPALPEVPLLSMLLGQAGGTIGETSALALLLGGVYLAVRKILRVRIPAAYLGTVAVLSWSFPRGNDALQWMCYSLLSGGVMLGAIFMATDYATSPVPNGAQWLFGIGCGALTVLFRYFGLFPEGITYAILLMNAAAPLLGRLFVPKYYGAKEEKQ